VQILTSRQLTLFSRSLLAERHTGKKIKKKKKPKRITTCPCSPAADPVHTAVGLFVGAGDPGDDGLAGCAAPAPEIPGRAGYALLPAAVLLPSRFVYDRRFLRLPIKKCRISL